MFSSNKFYNFKFKISILFSASTRHNHFIFGMGPILCLPNLDPLHSICKLLLDSHHITPILTYCYFSNKVHGRSIWVLAVALGCNTMILSAPPPILGQFFLPSILPPKNIILLNVKLCLQTYSNFKMYGFQIYYSQKTIACITRF